MERGQQLEELLLQSGLVKEEALQQAQRAREERGGSLVLHLVRGGVDEGDLARALGRLTRLPTVQLAGKRIDPGVLQLVPLEVAARYGCLPLFLKEEDGSRVLFLGLEDPTDVAVCDDVSFRAGLRVRPVVVGAVELRRALRAARTEAPPASAPRDAA